MSKKELSYGGISVIFGLSYILYLFGNPIAPMAFLTAASFLLLWLRGRGLDQRNSLIHLMLWSIPASFKNVLGGSYGELPISWFNICFLVFLTICAVSSLRNGATFDKRLIVAVMLAAFVSITMFISTILSRFVMDGMKDYLNVLIFLVIAVVGFAWDIDREEFRRSWIASACVASTTLFAQILWYKLTGRSVGYMTAFFERTAYASIFTDFSFLSLYFAGAATMALFAGRLWGLGAAGLLLAASALTTARTGLFSFLGIVLVIMLGNTIKTRKTASLLAFGVAISGAAIAIIWIARSRGTQSLFADNGRFATYRSGIQNFIHYPLFGTGLGITNYGSSLYTQSEFPHFTLLQLLAQTGITGTAPFVALIIVLIRKAWRQKDLLPELATILCFVAGSFFIPDIMNSRFFPLAFIGLGAPWNYNENTPDHNPV